MRRSFSRTRKGGANMVEEIKQETPAPETKPETPAKEIPKRKPRSDKGAKRKATIVPMSKPDKDFTEEMTKPKPKEIYAKPDYTYAYVMLAITLVVTAIIAYIFFIKPKLASKEGETVND